MSLYKKPSDALAFPDDDGAWVTSDGVLVMLNEGGFNCTQIDVRELVDWLRTHRPDLLAPRRGTGG